MKEFFKLCVITVAGMAAIASLLHLAVALGNQQSPLDALMYLGVAAGAFGVIGLLDTEQQIEKMSA